MEFALLYLLTAKLTTTPTDSASLATKDTVSTTELVS